MTESQRLFRKPWLLGMQMPNFKVSALKFPIQPCLKFCQTTQQVKLTTSAQAKAANTKAALSSTVFGHSVTAALPFSSQPIHQQHFELQAIRIHTVFLFVDTFFFAIDCRLAHCPLQVSDHSSLLLPPIDPNRPADPRFLENRSNKCQDRVFPTRHCRVI